MNTRNMKDLFGVLFWLFFAIYVCLESYRFGLGTWNKPGPGYFPFGAALLIGSISVVILLRTLLKAPAEKIPMVASKGYRWNAVLNLVAMIAYIFLLKTIGFVLCTFLLAIFFLQVVMPTRWGTTLIIAFSVSLGFHVVFNMLLGAQLPGGFLGF